MGRLTRAALLAVLPSLVLPLPAQEARWSDLKDGLKGRELVLRPTIEGRRKVYIEPRAAGAADVFALHHGFRLFPVRAAEPVRIVGVDPKGDHIEIELRSERLGRGRIDFYGDPPGPKKFESWLDEVFEVATPVADFHRYVGNRASRTLHIRGSNHLPDASNREQFADASEALRNDYSRCGVCFLPTPDVSGYETERSLAIFGLKHVRATYPAYANSADQDYVERIGGTVLDGWPVPLKGYRYRFQVVDADELNAFAVPTGYVFVTRGLLESLETEEEMAAILAHEIAHVESRHTYRRWRNARKAAAVAEILAVLSSGTDTAVDDIFTAMTSFTMKLLMAGHGRDREREADLFASFYLDAAGIGDRPLLTTFQKLKFAQDAFDPLGQGGGGLLASHPHIEERLDKAHSTVTAAFTGEELFYGVDKAGKHVVSLRFDVQRLFERELDVIATLTTTAELGEEANVNTLNVWVDDRRIRLRERTAEKIFPSDEVSAVFGNDDAKGLIEGPIERVDMEIRNVNQWLRADAFR